MKPILETSRALAAGETSSRALLEECLRNASQGEGERVYSRLFSSSALATADAMDALRAAGLPQTPLAGIPISIKDLFDVAGEITLAGSRALEDSSAAVRDAIAVERLRSAGAVIVGKTNMTEFAYSGLGINPHNGTPLNPFDRENGRIPGGSTSGGAVSVTDGMAVAAIGTDTGGSCRIPAALCGITGFKPSQRAVPLAGTFPLSSSLDSVGPLGLSVSCCAILHAAMSGVEIKAADPIPLKGLRFAILKNYVLEDMDTQVAETFEKALTIIGQQGGVLSDVSILELDELPEINAKGGFTASEAYALHENLLEQSGDKYDPRVSSRIRRGENMTAADYIQLLATRRNMIARVKKIANNFDVIVMPTVPQIAPVLSQIDNDEDNYHRANLLMLRNPTVTNFLDGCAVSIPCHEPDAAPVGLMLMGMDGADQKILRIGMTVENALQART